MEEGVLLAYEHRTNQVEYELYNLKKGEKNTVKNVTNGVFS